MHRRAFVRSGALALLALGLPPEFVELATRRAMAINDAYDRIRQERGRADLVQPPFN